MGCGCSKGKGNKYQVNYPDGKTTIVASLSEAITVARRVGGSYQKVR